MNADKATDYVASYRQDIKGGVPTYIVKSYIERQIVALEALPDDTEDKFEAIGQLSEFLKEFDEPSDDNNNVAKLG